MDSSVHELIDYADLLCDAILVTGCEACPIYNYDKVDEEKDFICPMKELINFLNLRG